MPSSLNSSQYCPSPVPPAHHHTQHTQPRSMGQQQSDPCAPAQRSIAAQQRHNAVPSRQA
jgi:hypothetical protein